MTAAALTSATAARLEVAHRMRAHLDESGLTAQQFARVLGTSASRLSTYLSGKVVPSATVLIRAEAVAAARPRLAETRALTITETGRAIAAAGAESTRLRIFFEFIRGADESGIHALALLEPEPDPTGDRRFDALIAAGAEHIAARYDRPGPAWTCTPDRYLHRAWWISDLPSARAFAMVWTPASFRSRGIYLDRHDLESR